MSEYITGFKTKIGCFQRKSFKSIIRSFCRRHKNVYYSMAESFSFPSSDFKVILKGDREKVELLVKRLQVELGELPSLSHDDIHDDMDGSFIMYFSNTN